MEDENDEGHFDDAGNFIWNKEEKTVQEEAWLDDLSEQQINDAKSALDRKAFRDELEGETMTKEEANRVLATLLQSRETVLQALKRLGSKGKRVGNKRKANAMDGTHKPPTAEETAQFVQITEAADFLMRIGEVDVYSQMKEEFIPEEELLRTRQQAREEQETKEEVSDVSNDRDVKKVDETMWEYKGADGAIHGPFSTSCFIAWQQQGYFIGDSVVDMRRVTASTPSSTATENGSKPALSAQEELMNDFEDEEEESKDSTTPEILWQKSDQIDFHAYRTSS